MHVNEEKLPWRGTEDGEKKEKEERRVRGGGMRERRGGPYVFPIWGHASG